MKINNSYNIWTIQNKLFRFILNGHYDTCRRAKIESLSKFRLCDIHIW